MYRKEIALDPGSWPREYRGSSTGTGVFYVRSPLGKAGRPEKGSRLRENTYSARRFSCRTGRPYVNSSPTEEPVMDSVALFVPGLADDQRS
jgi:hypothetical protein